MGRLAVLAVAAALLAGCGSHRALPFRNTDRSWHGDGVTVVATGDGPYTVTLYRPSTGLRKVLAPRVPWQLDARAVRFADVTGDGRDDVLLTILCGDCNHAAAAASVWTGDGRRIYGAGTVLAGKLAGSGVPGREISETAWGARRGLLWFDSPGPGGAVCCPRYDLHTLLRWTGRGWQTASRTRAPSSDDPWLRNAPYPAP